MSTSPDTLSRLTRALSDRYRVERELGAGGMATVYLAHDEKHDREVAIKVLHPDLGAALGSERFLAEIKTTAKLQHPHILPLLDSGEADGLLFYVMPLVEGETLRARLTRERQLPIDASIRIASEVAGALDYAHRHGVIHRDIKPENILLHDGRAVVADFGIALAVSAASGARMTQTGLSLGTPQYMSPEQATGEKIIDARADVYALGAVLYEMLTGEPPFSGATVQAIVAKVLTEKPMHPTAVRDTIPPHVEATLLKSLAKLPADRFADAAKFAEALAHPEATAGLRSATGARDAGGAATRSGRGIKLAAIAGWTAAIILGAILLWRSGSPPPAPQPVVKAFLPIVAGTTPAIISGATLLGITADGSKIAFTGVDSTRVPKIYVQSLATGELRRVPGSEFSTGAFLSPDGESVGHSSAAGLRITSLAGTGARTLAACSATTGLAVAGGVWGTDTMITWSCAGRLLRMRAAGGAVDTIASPTEGEGVYVTPSLSSDNRTVFFTIVGGGSITLAVLSLDSRKVTRLGIVGARPVLVADQTLTYGTRDGSLWAQPFDLKRLKTSGDPYLIAQGVSVSTTGSLRSAVAPLTGTVAFFTGSAGTDRELVLVDRNGRPRTVPTPKRPFRSPRFSPDGRKLAVGVMGNAGPGSGDLWVVTLDNGSMLRVTTDSINYHPEWEPDGRSLTFIRRTQTVTSLGAVSRVPVDGTRPPEGVISRPNGIWEALLTPDRRTIVLREDTQENARDILIADADSAKSARPLVASRFDEKGLALSPDGKWLAYCSDESGAAEIYVRRLDPGSPRWAVSQGGGVEPRWSKRGEILFRRGDSVFVTRVTLGAEPRVTSAEPLFAGNYDGTNYEPVWDVSPDGTQFAFVRQPGGTDLRIAVVLNAIHDPRAPRRP